MISATAALSMLLAAVPAMAAGGVELGVLTCNPIAGTETNLVIHSSVDVDCVFVHPEGEERYKGEAGISIGLDLSWKRTSQISYAVIGGSSDLAPEAYSLAGKYVGGKAAATVGIGAGLSVLIGGGNNNISLKPLGIEGSTGLGIQGGIGYLTLVKPGG